MVTLQNTVKQKENSMHSSSISWWWICCWLSRKKWDFQFFFFADQCSPISNGSALPSELPLWTDSTLSSSHFRKHDILLLINKLQPSNAHLHDKISIPMLKIRDNSICKLTWFLKHVCARVSFPRHRKKLILFQFKKRV